MRILIAEDEPISRRLLGSALMKWNYEVVEARDGAEAWTHLQRDDAPSLAIVDWLMPGFDGIELCRKLRQQPSTTPPYIILLTAKKNKDDVVAGLMAGADDYLIKPFEQDELRARLEVGIRVLKLQRNLAERVAELNNALAERKRVEKSLRESERRYRHLVDNSQGLICTHDLNGVLLSVNPAAARMLGYEPTEMVGRKLSEFIAPSKRAAFDPYLRRITRQATDTGLLHVMSRAGEEYIWQYHNARYEEEDGETLYVLGHAQDVTALKQAEAAMRSLSLSDDLTGLYNRRGFFDISDRHLKAARRSGRACLLFYADMDGLKQINDTFGHQEGSQAISQTAEIFKKTFRASDIIARIGGDEFAILAMDTCGEIEAILARLQENLQRCNAEEDYPYELSLSVGAVYIDSDNVSSIEELIIDADRVMYEQKRTKQKYSLSGGEREPPSVPQTSVSKQPGNG